MQGFFISSRFAEIYAESAEEHFLRNSAEDRVFLSIKSKLEEIKPFCAFCGKDLLISEPNDKECDHRFWRDMPSVVPNGNILKKEIKNVTIWGSLKCNKKNVTF